MAVPDASSGRPPIMPRRRTVEPLTARTEDPAPAATTRDSLATAAYNRLRAAILDGRLRPNQRLIEADLAEQLDVSRTPLREALMRLVADGLVDSARRSWIVHEYTAEEIREIHEVRASLEGMAAFLAARRAVDDDIAAIVALHEAADRRRLAEDPAGALVSYNDGFHSALLAAAGNARLRRFADLNHYFFFTSRTAKLYTPEEVHESLVGHDRCVEALKVRDAEEAERAMRLHVLQSLDVLLRKLT